MRSIGICILVLCGAIPSWAAEQGANKPVETIIRAWQLDAWTGVADTLAGIDSSYMHFPMRDRLNDYSISNVSNSNLVTPSQIGRAHV